MRFPAHKAGAFSRFLTICSGRYSLECSPLIFFCSRDWRSWCWTWPGGGIFLVLKLGLHLLLGEPQGTEGGGWAPSRHYREQRCWRAGTASTPRRQQSITLI